MAIKQKIFKKNMFIFLVSLPSAFESTDAKVYECNSYAVSEIFSFCTTPLQGSKQ